MGFSDPLEMSPGRLSNLSFNNDELRQIICSITTFHILGAILLFVFTVALWRRYFSPLSDVPGPFFASFTRLWHVKTIIDGNQNVQLHQQHEKHGPIVRLAPNEVSVTHPDGVKKLFLQPMKKGDFYHLAAIPDWRYQNPMSAIDPKDKIERSKAFASGYSASNVLKYETAMNPLIEKLGEWINKYAESGEPMDLEKFLTYTAFDVVGEILFSKPFGFIEKGHDIENGIATNQALQALGTPIGEFRWAQILLGNPLVTRLGLSPGSMLQRNSLAALAERQHNPDARFDLAAHWFRYLAQHPDRTTLRNVQSQTIMNVGAGSDTVSCGLQSTLYHMARHRPSLRRAQDEMDAARREGRCLGSVVAYADAQQLPYLQACIKEGLRIHSPVPMGLPRIAGKGGVTIGDRTFPEGTTLSISPWVLHHSKEIWGDDADEWNPDRWLVEDTTVLERNWVPFGAGWMGCPGQHAARMELSKFISLIIRDFAIKLMDPSKEWKWRANFTMVGLGEPGGQSFELKGKYKGNVKECEAEAEKSDANEVTGDGSGNIRSAHEANAGTSIEHPDVDKARR